jgi:phosphate/sulfate permease
MEAGVMFAALVAGLVYSGALGMLGIVALAGVVFAGFETTPTLDDTIIGDYILQVTLDADDGSVWPNTPFVS